MSNIKFVLLEVLKNNNPELYEKVKLEEILFLIRNIQQGDIDIDNYEVYFNRKCIPDYKRNLIQLIIKDIEPNLLTHKKKNKRNMIKIFKIISLLKKLLEKETLEKYVTDLVDTSNLIASYAPYKKLSKKLDIFKEMKNKDEKDKIVTEMNVLKNNIIKTTIKSIMNLYSNGSLNYNDVINNINKAGFKLLKNLIFDMINNHSDTVSRINDISIEYLDLLISILTKDSIKIFYDFINQENLSVEYNIENELLFNIMQYKYLQNSDFKYLANLLVLLEDEEELTIELLSNILNSFEKTKLDTKTKFLIYIFLNILETCEVPHNKDFMNYLKRIYLTNDQEAKYESIVMQGNIYSELSETVKNVFQNTILYMKRGKDLIYILNNILKSNINKSLTEEEYEGLMSDVKVLHKITKNKEATYEILNQHYNAILSSEINKLIEFDIILNKNQTIADLSKNLNISGHDDLYIKQQMQLYEIEKSKNGKTIYINAPNILKDNTLLKVFVKYNEWMNRAMTIKKDLKINILTETNQIFQNILSKILQHYFKSLQVYLDKEDNDSYNTLFYYLDEEKIIKVHTANSLEQIILYIRDELSKKNVTDKLILEFIIQKLHFFIFNHHFYSKLHEKEIILFDIIKDDRVIVTNLSLRLTELNTLLKKNNLKELKTNSLSKKMKEYKQQDYDELYQTNIQKTKYKSINRQNNTRAMNDRILTKEELRFLAINIKKTIFEFLYVKDGERASIVDNRLLEYIKNIIHIVKTEVREVHSFNILKKNISRVEHMKISESRSIIHKLIRGEYDLKYMKLSIPKKIIHSNTNKIHLDNTKQFEKNDVGFLELQALKHYFKDNKEEEDYFQTMILNLVKHNVSLLNIIFNVDLTSHTMNMVKLLSDNYLKIKGIMRKLLYKLKLNKLHEVTKQENSVIQDIVKELCILYYADKIIMREGTMERYLESKNLLIIEDLLEKIIGKDVLIIKTNKKGKIIGKVGDKYKIGNKTLKRGEFILIETLKNKVVRIRTGNYKGEYGVIQDYQMNTFLTTKEKESRLKYIQYLEELINSKVQLINNLTTTSDKIFKEEIKLIHKIRKTKLSKLRKVTVKDQEMKDEILHLKLNINVKKMLNTTERLILEKQRKNRKSALELSLVNLRNQLKTNSIKQRKNFNIKVRYGELSAKNIFLTREDFSLNMSDFEQEEMVTKITTVKNKKFDNLYQVIYFLFNNLNTYVKPELELNLLQYYHVLYKNTLKLLNIQKITDINKIKIVSELKEKLTQLENQNMKINKRMKKSSTKELVLKLSKNNNKIEKLKSIITTKSKKLESLNLEDILIEDTKDLEKFTKDLEFETIGNKKYTLLKENTLEINKEIIIHREFTRNKNQKDERKEEKKINKIIKSSAVVLDNFMKSLNKKIPNCNLLNNIMHETDYYIDNYETEEKVETQEGNESETLTIDEINQLIDTMPDDEESEDIIDNRMPDEETDDESDEELITKEIKHKTWVELEEEDSEMDFDEPIPGVEELLKRLKKN